MGEFRYVGEDALRARFLEALEPEVVDHADEVVHQAKADTPELSTRLMRSERTTDPKVGENQVSERIVAGEGTDYGVIIHEKDAIHHDNGSAHFLSRPVLASVPRLLDRVAAAGRKAY